MSWGPQRRFDPGHANSLGGPAIERRPYQFADEGHSLETSEYCATMQLCIRNITCLHDIHMLYCMTSTCLDLLQVSLSLSYRSTIVYITWRSMEGRSEKERLVNFGKSRILGSKLNRKCNTCFNCFPSISFCIIYYNGTHVIYTVLDQYI
jgi:hypothetical protein